MRITWAADVLRAAGLDVYEDPGWKGRGRELKSVQGIVWHHTATGPKWLDGHVLALLRNGRPDVPGPLSQFGLERGGTWVCVADGRANHNGYGVWGNDSVGVEAYNDGVGEPWPDVMLDSYVRGAAALSARLGLTAAQNRGHREQDPRRKIDPAGIDMHWARTQVDRVLTAGPTAPPVPTPGGFLMALNDKQQDDLLRMTTENWMRLQQLQAELVSPIGKDGLSRQDRMVKLQGELVALARAEAARDAEAGS